ncbi:MAG: DUF3857 domain-containing protein, partial [bacterium]|nr:DUF3857 domain-containing protein [bacterium]
CFLLFTLFVSADIIYLNDGEEYSGTVEKIEDNKIHFRIQSDNSLKVFDKSEVEILKLSLALENSDKKNVSELNDPILNEALNYNTENIPETDSGYIVLYECIEFSPDKYIERKIIKITSESGTYIGDQKYYFKRDSEEFNINYARTINPEGKLFQIYENGIQEETINYDNQYSRLNSVKFTLPEVRMGNVIDFKITKTRKKDLPLEEPFIKESFIDSVPIIRKEIRISGFTGIPGYKEVLVNNNGEYNIPKVTKTSSGSETIYSSREIDAYTRESFIPPMSLIAPTLFAGVSSEQSELSEIVSVSYPGDDEILEKIFSDLYSRFYSPESNQKLEEELMIEVYSYISENLTSVDILPESYYFKPKSIKEILDNKRGNYLDKNYLFLRAITHAQGFSGGLLFISPFYEGYCEDSIINLNQFYLPICYIKTPSGKEFYIDAYSDRLTWGTVQDYYFGNPGVLVQKNGMQKIDLKLPDSDLNLTETKINVKLKKNGDGEVTLKTIFHGVDSEYIREFKEVTNVEIELYFNELILEIARNATLVSYDLFNLDNLLDSPGYEIKFIINNLVKNKSGLYLFSIPGLNYSAYEVGVPERLYPLFWSSMEKQEKTITIEFEPGFKVKYIPSGKDYLHGDFLYKSTFKNEGNKIIFKDEQVRKGRLIRPQSYSEYKQMIEDISNYSKEMIILEK